MRSVSSPQLLRAFVLSFFLFGTFAGDCHAPEPPPDPSPAECVRLAEEHIQSRLAHWQKRLGLEAWKISAILSRPDELRPGTMGNIRWDANRRTARIRVLEPAGYRMPLQAALRDMEFTIVHELIHLELSSLPRSEASRSDEEHAINRIANALLQRDRESQ